MTHSHIGWSTLIVSLALGLAAPAAAQDAQKLSELERKIDVLYPSWQIKIVKL